MRLGNVNGFYGDESSKEFIECNGEKLKTEKLGEVLKQARFHFGQGDGTVEEFFERSGFAFSDAAGDDEIEVTEIGGNVIGKAVRSDPAADVHADGGELFFRGRGGNPDAGLAGDAIGGDAEISRGADHDFFESANVPMNVLPDARKIEDGIADDLARTVVSDVSAAIGSVEFDAFLAEHIFGGEKIFAFAVAAESDDVGMLAEEKNVIDGAGFASGDDALLQGVGVGEGDETEVDDEERIHSVYCLRITCRD